MNKTLLMSLIAIGLLLIGGLGYRHLTAPDDTPRASAGGSARGMMGGRQGGAGLNSSAPVIQSIAAERVDRQPAVTLFGQTRFSQTWQVVSEVSARVSALHVDSGDRVSAGDLLLELDARDLNRSLARIETQIAEMEARIRQEQRQGETNAATLALQEELLAFNEQALRRATDLRDRNLASTSDVEAARRDMINQQQTVQNQRLVVERFDDDMAQLEAQRAGLELDREALLEDLEATQVRAPTDGLIDAINVRVGQSVSTNSDLLTLHSIDPFQIRATLPAGQIGLLNREQPLRGEMQWQGHTTELVLHNWGVSSRDGGVSVTFNMVDPSPPLVSDSYTTLRVYLPMLNDVIAVPASALYGNNRIYVVDDGRLRGEPADILGQDPDRAGEGYLIRADGVASGEAILTTRLDRPETGLRVQRLSDLQNGAERQP